MNLQRPKSPSCDPTRIIPLCCVIAFAVVARAEADEVVPGPDWRAFHREVPNDPPAPRPATPPPGVRSVGPVVKRGSFESVQVNVDEFGNNIPGDAANEPSIAVDPTDRNRIVIGWRQFDSINSDFRQAGWSFSHDGGRTWTFPGVLEPGVFRSDPVLDADAQGNVYYYSLFTDFVEFRCDMYISGDGGESWQGPFFAYGGDKAWMTIDRTDGIGRGNIYTACNTGGNNHFPRTFTRSTDGGFEFDEPIELPNRPIFGTLSVGPDGELFVVGVDSDYRVVRSSNAQDPDASPVFELSRAVEIGGSLTGGRGPNPIGLLGQAWIATDHSPGPNRGNVYVLGSVNPPVADPLDVMFVRSTDGGLTWSAPVRVNDDPQGANRWQWFGMMSVAPNGRIDAVWNDTRNDPEVVFSELYYSFSEDGGLTWAENVPISQPFNHFLGYPGGNRKLGDYYDMVSDDNGVSIAYAATFNGEQDVYYLRVDHSITVLPSELTVVRGRLISGDLTDLFHSDDSRLLVHPGVTQEPTEPPVWLILEGVASTGVPSGLSFILESRVDTPGVTQRIELFNFVTQEFEEVDSRPATREDSVVDVMVDGDPSRFIDPETLAIRAQLTWKPPPLVLMFPWTVGIDQAIWKFTP